MDKKLIKTMQKNYKRKERNVANGSNRRYIPLDEELENVPMAGEIELNLSVQNNSSWPTGRGVHGGGDEGDDEGADGGGDEVEFGGNTPNTLPPHRVNVAHSVS